jgi:Icc-related predicted phosphoesterase
MTNILLCSDLHTNFYPNGGKTVIESLCNTNVDVLVVAGDLSIIKGNLLQTNIKQLCNKFPEVVYVAGNHSYYYNTFSYVDDILANLDSKIKNFTWLNNTRVNIAGQSFIGATLWFSNNTSVQKYKHLLNDYNCILNFEPEIYNRNQETIEFFRDNIQEGDILVTHHMPSSKCIAPIYKDSVANCFFFSDLDGIICSTKPALGLYGHTHFNNDFVLHSTRLLCNPRGYPGQNPMFSESLIITV